MCVCVCWGLGCGCVGVCVCFISKLEKNDLGNYRSRVTSYNLVLGNLKFLQR